jgi:outer membrane receptor protein involved in Fe transport
MRTLKSVLFILTAMLITFASKGQVTTSSISGTVKTNEGTALEGASITAVHGPSGTTYTTVSKKSGAFNLPGLRIGGPYVVKIDYVGLKSESVENIFLSLGEPFSINSVLVDASKTLTEVTVLSQKRKSGIDKNSATTVVGQAQLNTLPSISRSISDFTRLTPQANGTSFAGRDGRYNNTMIDGANLNNNFGLSSDPLPGGGSNPISLDAIEELSVSISPFDVKQSNFTGAGINAITKSGTNTLKGTAYGFYRNQDYNGKKVGSVTLPAFTSSENKTYGASLGGAIIKNKLFFFANYESEEKNVPGIPYSPKGGSGAGNVSSTSVDSLKKFSDFLNSKYSFDPGSYDNFPNFITKNHKFLVKIDWNISNAHKLTLKYSELVNQNDQQLNGSSIPNGGGFAVVGGTGTVSRLPNNRFGLASMSFSNSNYGFKDIVKTGSIELNSNFKGRASNQFLATITKVQDTRTIPGGVTFPTIDIFNNNGQNYMSAGTDPFTRNNDVINDIYTVTDNFNYYAGKHTITAGISYEYQKVGNMFMPASQSYYAYNSLADFMANKAPVGFSYTFSLVPGQDAVYSANLKIGQLGVYAQDEVNINPNFKLTYGLRIDKPIYPEQPLENPNITALTLADQNGNPTHYSTGAWPKATAYWSPRVGFRYKLDDENIVIRGGTGIFTGRIPFVYLTNIPTNSQMYQQAQTITSPALLANYLFNPNPDAYRGNFTPTPGILANNANIVMADENFKFPQVWRTNLAFDKKLGDGWLLSMDFLYTKDINAVVMRNANQKSPNGSIVSQDSRPRYLTTADRRINQSIGSAIILENSTKGSSASLTAQIAKTATKGFYGSLAYTYSYALEVTANPGSTASSVWNSNANVGTQNSLELANSQYVMPHRFIGAVSYRIEYAKHLATTISVFGELNKQRNYSYSINGDLNNDGNSADLMFISKNVLFVNQTASGSNPARTVAEQTAAWSQFIDNTPYLSKNLGNYAGRNSAYLPWYSKIDIRILQDLYTNIGNRKNTIQISADILNAGNLFNKMAGVQQSVTTSTPLVFKGFNANGEPTYNLTQLNGLLVTQPFQNTLSIFSTWGLQLGVRYIF